jgi:hypothetical protein
MKLNLKFVHNIWINFFSEVSYIFDKFSISLCTLFLDALKKYKAIEVSRSPSTTHCSCNKTN